MKNKAIEQINGQKTTAQELAQQVYFKLPNTHLID